jgi:hypothetical protein
VQVPALLSLGKHYISHIVIMLLYTEPSYISAIRTFEQNFEYPNMYPNI